jgi:hypothetical protein
VSIFAWPSSISRRSASLIRGCWAGRSVDIRTQNISQTKPSSMMMTKARRQPKAMAR